MNNITSFNPKTNNQQANNPINNQNFDSQAAIRRVIQNALGGHASSNKDTFSREQSSQDSTQPFTFNPMVEEITADKVIKAGDKDGNKSLNEEELINLLRLHINSWDIKTDKALGKVFKEIDKNNDGELTADEIKDPMKLLFNAKIQNARDLAESSLEKIDKKGDDDGKASKEEIGAFVKSYFNLYSNKTEQNTEEYKKMITGNIFEKLDKDNNQKLDLDEMEKLFKEILRNINPIDGKGAFKSFEIQEDEEKTTPVEDIQFTQP